MKQFFKRQLLLGLLLCTATLWAIEKDLVNLTQALEQLGTAAEEKVEKAETVKALTDLETWTDYCFKNFPEGYYVTYAKPSCIKAAWKVMPLSFPFKTEISNLITQANNQLEKQYFTDGPWYENKKPDINRLGIDEFIVEMRPVTPQHTLCIVGDIHGSIHSLLRILWSLVIQGHLTPDFKIVDNNFILVFLGDYIDRGAFGLEVMYTVLRLFTTNQKNVVLLRGNHEELNYEITTFSKDFTFGPELIARFFGNFDPSNKSDREIEDDFSKRTAWDDDIFYDLFRRLPIGLFVTCSNFVLQICHAGAMVTAEITPEGTKKLKSLDALDNVWNTDQVKYRLIDADLARFLMWGDFKRSDKMGKNAPEIDPEAERPVTGSGKVSEISKTQHIDCFIRGHQHDNYTCKLLPKPEEKIIEPTGLATKHIKDPQWWRNVVKQDKITDFLASGIPLGALSLPVLTFTTTTAWNISTEEGFGLLKLANTFADSRLFLNERTILAAPEEQGTLFFQSTQKKQPLSLEQTNKLKGTLTGKLIELKKKPITYLINEPKQEAYLYPIITCDYKTKKLTVDWKENPADKPVTIVK